MTKEALLMKELKLPEFINGLRPNFNAEFGTTIHDLETCRVLQSLYRQCCFARLSLYHSYVNDERLSKKDDYLQVWGKCLNLNNSILWYNSCLDLLLQAMWLKKRLYLNVKKKNGSAKFEGINSKSLESILHACTYNKTLENLTDTTVVNTIKQFSLENTHIKQLANSLKHKNGVEYKQIEIPELMSFGDDYYFDEKTQRFKENKSHNVYSSIKTRKIEDMHDIQEELIKYHKDFYALLTRVCHYLEIPAE